MGWGKSFCCGLRSKNIRTQVVPRDRAAGECLDSPTMFCGHSITPKPMAYGGKMHTAGGGNVLLLPAAQQISLIHAGNYKDCMTEYQAMLVVYT